ncbi:type II secretion system ATPase GspE [Pectobacterium carotovorum]|uniref:Type II secretion system protein E n=1 Tax=Pectobacterium carotovorum subsp. carotovorum TaxID=555 RepID=A0AAI9PED8_PECCC|nr:type II secretion system ATPase GspE [Pectobacterium carotovorum]KHT26043.1 general secretion pathway protein GspE [Pectobacterium carotovorum subsp. carotovorum]KHT34660.1 general secretion pathway protein GspE [Pectobacterium carotovorum subsp. carotovorum]MBA0180130.1 type II secretion system ATPase GspE [Pectobacterium carotovorum]MBA0191656.1 type II secretion system ATPase GspE [Pectobacterium carotovorum]MBA0199081.1 type II secretion system ATPase GspE [Pectobacterium carotovorum]
MSDVASQIIELRPILPFAYARSQQILLLQRENDASLQTICVAQTLPAALLEARRIAGCSLRIERVTDEEFERQLVISYQRDSEEARRMMEDIGNEMDFYTLVEELPDSDDLLDADDDAPIIRLINAMLTEAIKNKASDIHIETYERYLLIRFRVDGVLREILRPQRKLASLLVSRIKVMAKLDIAEKRVPQDGRMALRVGGRAIDVRVSTLPSNYGERVVLRLLDKNSVKLDLELLGMSERNRQLLDSLIHRPHGIILVTGPTGSGKSTTLYAALSRLNASERNIMTVEDPIEYELEGIGQTQVNTKVDMTFARGLRAILRQDPDVVLVGEIRDGETAQIAVQASLTGHLVLSTLHTNSALGALSRLQDMGVEPFLLSTSLLGVLAQRLVRTLCSDCSQPQPVDPVQAEQMGIAPGTLLHNPVGCPQCSFTGYRGRIGIHELVLINDDVRAAIHRSDGEMAIAQILGGSRTTIRQDGLNKVLAGLTTWEEVIRVTKEE